MRARERKQLYSSSRFPSRSADLWVPSVACASSECPYARFDPEQSSTFWDTGQAFSIEYGTGSASGTFAVDAVEVGGARVDQQQFGLANKTANIILPSSDPTAANGILGIGYPALTSTGAATPYDPFVFSLAKQGLIAEPVFSVYMGSIYDPGWAGEIVFGGLDQAKVKKDQGVKYAPVARLAMDGIFDHNGIYAYWMVYGQSLRVLDEEDNDDVVLDASLGQTRGVIIDTGTTLTYMQLELVEPIVLALAGSENNVVLDESSGTFIVNCALQDTQKRLEIGIGAGLRAVNPDTLLRVSLSMQELIIPLDSDSLQDAKLCMFGIAPWIDDQQASLSSSGIILLGDSVLRSLYLVFDMGQNRIGFGGATNTTGAVAGESLNTTLEDNEPIRWGKQTQEKQFSLATTTHSLHGSLLLLLLLFIVQSFPIF